MTHQVINGSGKRKNIHTSLGQSIELICLGELKVHLFNSAFVSDPGCVSNTSGSMDWLQRNFGIFSVFAELQELQVLNPDFSSVSGLGVCLDGYPLNNITAPLTDMCHLSFAFSICRRNHCRCLPQPKWHNWHWPLGHWMTQMTLNLCLRGWRKVTLSKMLTSFWRNWPQRKR